MLAQIPEPLRKLVGVLAELPSIGPRQATRIAFYLAGKGGNAIREFSRSLEELASIKTCERCFFPTLPDVASGRSGPRPESVGVIPQGISSLCGICADPSRDPGTILIIEKETDLISLEHTGKFRGRYFIVGPIPKIGALAEWQKLRLERLESDIEKLPNGKAKEIILGFNPTSVGDLNASIIARELAPFAEKLTRLGRGLPTGGEIEFADGDTLGSALEGRG